MLVRRFVCSPVVCLKVLFVCRVSSCHACAAPQACGRRRTRNDLTRSRQITADITLIRKAVSKQPVPQMTDCGRIGDLPVVPFFYQQGLE